MNGPYQRYAKACQSQAKSPQDDQGLGEQRSVLVRNFMPAKTAQDLSAQMSHLLAEESPLDKESTTHLMKKIDAPISTLGRSVVDIFYSAHLVQHIRRFFGTHLPCAMAGLLPQFSGD